MQKNHCRINAIPAYIAAILIVASCLALPQTSYAAASPGSAAQRYIECARPALQIGDAIVSQGNGGYGIEVQGERYFFVYDERLTFSLLSADGRSPAAHVKLDRSPSQFSEQSQWRERWMEDIAERSRVPLIRQAPAGSVTLLTVNKKALTGKSAGLSVLIDPAHQIFVQLEWDNSTSYAGPQDVAALQAATWKNLLPCLARDTAGSR